MYLDRAIFTDYRNLSKTVELAHPVSVLVGQNNAGKSNVVDALRMALTPLGGSRDRLAVERDDFRQDDVGEPAVSTFTVELGFGGLTVAQQGRLLTMLDPSAGPARASLRLEATLPEQGRPRVHIYGGQAQLPEVEEWAREAVTFTYLPPLRDAEGDLRPGRGPNRLVNLLTAFAPDEADQKELVDLVRKANDDMRQAKAVRESRDSVQSRLDSILGSDYAQQVDLLFAEPQFTRIVGALRALVGDASAREMSQNGLGYNNLLYMATLLAGLAKEPEGELHLLLVEEPEAHLHPQLQALLMRFLEEEADARADGGRVQVLLTTHSPNLTSAARVERITAMVRRTSGAKGFAIGKFGLEQTELDHLARFLDVTKAALLFARAVILVEGLAEQLLLPILAEVDGPSLEDAQVTVVNIGGLAFGPFAHLYAPDRLPYRCAVVSDADPPKPKHETNGSEADEDTTAAEDTAEAQTAEDDGETTDVVLSATASKLHGDQNENRRVFLSTKTFEWDLVMAGNWPWTLAALTQLHPRVGKRLSNDTSLNSDEKRADALLDAVAKEKGRFAQALAQTAADHDVKVPDYIAQALTFACKKPLLRPPGPDVAQQAATPAEQDATPAEQDATTAQAPAAPGADGPTDA